MTILVKGKNGERSLRVVRKVKKDVIEVDTRLPTLPGKWVEKKKK